MYSFDDIIHQPILICGVGSIGERHIRNLWQLGFHNIYAYRQRGLDFRDLGGAQIQILTQWSQVKELRPFAAFIATPSSLHMEQAIACVELHAHTFVEKPLANDASRCHELIEAIHKQPVLLYVGYMMRFHPLIKKLKAMIEAKTYGELISLQSKWGEYLPDWHPWEDYRTSYAAKKELGGGAALTLSHDIDLSNYLIDSEIDSFRTLKNYRSNLEVDVESGADILIKYQNNVTANIHLNFYEHVPERFLKLVFDTATVCFDYYEASLTIKQKGQTPQIIKLDHFDRNQLFIDQMAHFFMKINQFTYEDSIKQVKDSERIIQICNEQ